VPAFVDEMRAFHERLVTEHGEVGRVVLLDVLRFVAWLGHRQQSAA
jgi:hypothetical protein